ncbi:hypothetical protein [Marinicauda sp. Alg238-R41]|uniref:hypothetical protein n=1 Tax=Marinicauda sp. Alg238-R41 TaxID=2993447 RepID=UPI0022E367DA|nr:hypothetical protein [Marinicauda sp. Alg238-R41]
MSNAVSKNMRSVFRFALFGVGRFSGTGLQFAVLALIGYLLGDSALGVFATGQSLVVYAGTLASLGLPAFILRRSATKKSLKSPPTAVWLSVTNTLSLGAAVILSCLSVTYFILSEDNAIGGLPASVVVGLCLGAGAYAIVRTYAESLKGQRKLIASTSVEFIFPFVIAMLGVMLVAFKPTIFVQYIALTLALGYVFSSLYCIFICGSRPRFLSLPRSIRRIRYNIGELISLHLVQVGNQSLLALPVILAAALLTYSDAAVVGVALRLIGLSATATALIIGFWAKDVVMSVRSSDIRKRRQVFFKLYIFNFMSQALVLGTVAAFPQFVLSLFSIDVAVTSAEASAVRVLALLRLARGFFGTPEIFLINAGRSGYDLISHVLALTVFGLIIVLSGSSLFTIALAAGAAGLVRGGISAGLVSALVLFPRVER